jgi:hypothetical protein
MYGRMALTIERTSDRLLTRELAEDYYDRPGYHIESLSGLSFNTEVELYRISVDGPDSNSSSDSSDEINSAYVIQSELNHQEPFSNIAIAAATAAYARMEIYPYKVIPGNMAIYSDTDSVLLEKPLAPELVGNKIGQMKLEHVIQKAILVRPKTYMLVTESGKEIKKVSGYSNSNTLTWSDYNVLLREGGSISKVDSRTTKDMSTLKVTHRTFNMVLTGRDLNRIHIYDANGVSEYTVPYLLKEGVIVDR